LGRPKTIGKPAACARSRVALTRALNIPRRWKAGSVKVSPISAQGCSSPKAQRRFGVTVHRLTMRSSPTVIMALAKPGCRRLRRSFHSMSRSFSGG
jgi:hypothetical protein